MARKRGNAGKGSREKILNAFDTAVDDEYYIKGLRHQQDIDLDNISDERIRQLLSNEVDSGNDEEIDSDEAMGSGSDISLGEPDSGNEDEWGDSFDESELLPLDEIWDLDTKEQEEEAKRKASKASGEKGSAIPHRERDTKRSDIIEQREAGSALESGSHAEIESESDSELASESDAESESEADSESASDGLELDEMSESSDEDGDDEALLKAIKSVSGADELGPSSHRLADAGEENPFTLPGSGSKELSLQEIIPGTKEGRTLAVPAPKRVQERADRSAALDLANSQLGKWADTVTANRQAEHLEFPINAPPELQAATPFVQVDKEEQTSLEQSVSQILKDSALADENAVSTFEQMAPSTLSIEEVRKRRNELRYMRELMYREEQRAKRIKKIKSKSFRKVHKRERERMQELEEGEEGEDIEKAERARALERATLRHRATSKWAKRMTDQGLTRDAGTRTEIEEMLRQGEALKQKIRGNAESQDEDSDEDSESELKHLESDAKTAAPTKGLLGMKFMREADEREREANARVLRDDYSDAEDEDQNIGRKSFDPAGQQLKRDLAAREESDESDNDNKNSSRSKKKNKSEVGSETIELRRRDSSDDEDEAEEETSHTEQSRHSRQNFRPSQVNEASVPKQKTTAIQDNPWLAASANASTPGTVRLAKPSAIEPKQRGQKTGSKSNIISVENTLGDTMIREKDMTLQQQDLVREAFAGDDVVAEFDAEKQREVEEDGDQEIDETLPGWGSWSTEKPRVQKIRKITGINTAQRKDFKKGGVIINEKVNKKAAKYNASAVPFPFENRQQYERSLRMPIGQEWATRDTFQRQTKPRVLVKRGTVIEPIKKPHSN